MSRTSTHVAILLVVAAISVPGRAVAEPVAPAAFSVERTARPRPRPPRWWRMAIESSAVIAIGSIWYWAQTSLQSQDWDLYWDAPSWQRKLTDPGIIRFDTNGYSYNAINHPFAGALYYQIGRSNELGPAASLGVSLALTLFWEYVVEFKEFISLNDIVFNMHAGLAIGEPLRQAGASFLAGSGPLSIALAGATAPFDVLHSRLDRRRPADGAPRSRLELTAGSGAWFDGGPRPEVGAGFALEVIAIPGFGAAGEGNHRVGIGGLSRIEASQAFDPTVGRIQRTGARFLSRTTLFGRYRRQLVDTPTGLRGSERLFALGTGFTYDTRLLTAEKDRLTVAHLAGAQAVLVSDRGPFTVRLDSGLYVDFGMVQALVFGPSAPPHPEMPLTSALQERGYYFGGGSTAETRLELAYAWFRLEGVIRAHGLFAIDGLDRREIGGPEDPHGVSDQRVVGRLRIGVGLGPGPFSLSATAERSLRRGAWSDRSRTIDDGTLGIELSVAP